MSEIDHVTVDVGLIGFTTIAEGAAVSFAGMYPGGLGWSGWYRPAWGFNSDNAAGMDVVIGDTGSWPHRYGEAQWIDDNGNVWLAMTLVNRARGTASVYFSWLQAPAFGR